ncbi:tyrosine-type recombinase/integrase [Novosphingobium album (ex Liu et al. 2023)]|uniref:Integrase arm-type DNA-binding domain-containing protein n=1 Tax=Novosphingobium album (ex Liu et al. 2023) TaxID=3031130 RepID=A0ABT5WMH8_9SPHN|nr:integrase arm-type DNA-binding domain-containing protein [Novosphingobium album (ex Liu et al. 2023)]MDE8651089.1 integrase arm-type DNA-binding domain-containing protein [Novosphingobium album (ex Liu et al. 2023)]
MLTDAECRKCESGEKDRKLSDGKGLYLLVRKSGSKLWRLKYEFAGREKTLSIGAYPEVSLKAARDERDRARMQLRQGIDPSAEKQRRKAQAAAEALNSFEKAARAWHEDRSKTLSERYSAAVLSRLEQNVFKRIGPKPVREITPAMVLDTIRAIEKRGAHDMAHRVRNHISDVFVWAIASGLAEYDPAAIIRKALRPTDPKLRPAMIKLAQVRKVLKLTEALPGVHWSTLLASRLLALTAARPGVIRMAELQEFENLDGDAPIWRIPAAKMKLTRQRKRDVTWEFVIPLSQQAAATARAAIGESMACRFGDGPRWLFTGIGDPRRPISDGTISKIYRDAGFTNLHVPHGWRSSFSTIMNERAAIDERDRDRAIIDLMLAHAQAGVEPIYNRAAYMPRRREIAQEWADLLMKGLPGPETLLPDQRPWRAVRKEAAHDGAPHGRPAH